MDMNALKPTISFRLQSSTAVHSAPLWLMKPTEPGRAMVVANVAFKPVSGHITPRQFGPITRILAARASSSTCCSSAAPAGPTSLKPAEITTAPRTPVSPHSRMMPGIDGGGVTTTARSTGSGMSESDGYAFTPSTLARLGFTGKTVPPKGLVIRFQRMVRPTLPTFSVAPTTATLLGEKNTSSAFAVLPWTGLRVGLVICMFPRFRLRSERGVIQRIQNVRNAQAILARHGSDITIIADRVKPEPLENGNGVGMTLFHVTDDHVAADQLIESEHRRALNEDGDASRIPKQNPGLSTT